MIESEHALQQLILLVGALIVLAVLVRSGLRRIGIPSLVGYLVIGFLLRLEGSHWHLLTGQAQRVLEFLANIGVISLLFRVGLESNLAGLLSQLRRAGIIWFGNVLLSGVLGYVTSYFLLGLTLVPSLFIAVALTATSVGIPVSVWQEAHALNSANGELMLDVAEMDDISAIALMALLFAVVPVLKGDTGASVLTVLARASWWLLLKMTAFVAFCLLFSRYAEHYITSLFKKIKSPPDPMLMVAGIGFMIAALAGLLGFSVAIGAFFAGLVFSRDPEAVKTEASFEVVYELFTPFFFIGIGLHIDPNVLTSGVGLGAVLLIVAVFGKVIGAGVPTLMTAGWVSSVLIGVSMSPRAEIAMFIMQQGHKLGEWAVPHQVFAAMVMVSAVTCIITPLILRSFLLRWPQTNTSRTKAFLYTL